MPKKKKNPISLFVRPSKLSEQFKGEVTTNKISFPKELGEAHPFPFIDTENTYKRVGLAKAAVDKHLDFIISPGFYVESEDKKAEVLINQFIQDVSFEHHLRVWIQEALIKGNGFMELGLQNDDIQLKVINANNMFVERNKRGEIIGYNQFVGGFNKFDMRKVIPFEPNEIAHLKINSISDGAYGIGILFPTLSTLNNLLMAESDMHILNRRKANAPLHVKLGTELQPATNADVDDFGQKLEYLNNLHEWTTDHRVEMDVIKFGDVSQNFSNVLQHDIDKLFFEWQIPAVLMGMARIPEGLANVQLDTFERRIQSLQAEIERIVEEKIFRPILNMNGLDSHVEMHWGQASETKINQRLIQLTSILNNSMLSPQLRAAIELDIANNLGLDDAVKVMQEPEEDMDEQREREREETTLQQPEIPGEKESFVIEDKDMTLKEWLNFDYQNYIKEVLDFIRKDKFSNLLATTNEEIELGKLTKTQVAIVKGVMEDGFTRGLTIRDISENMNKIDFKDRFKINDVGEKVLLTSASKRGINITRTESTRVASEGVLNHFNKKNVEQVRFVASISERTCPECLARDGRIFTLQEARGVIPIHSMCRCSFIAIT